MRGENVQRVAGREDSAWSSNEDCEDENPNARRIHWVIKRVIEYVGLL